MLKIPDFIGIGVARSATSWIYAALTEHPEICGGKIKEIHFFDQDYNFKKGIAHYLSFFANCPENKLKGEFTPSYFSTSKVAERIYENFPNVKLILCLRNPIEKVYSNYRYHVERKLALSIYKKLEDAINNEKKFLEKGLYYKHLNNYLELYPREQILILLFDDIISDPLDVVSNLYSFLEVENQNFIPKSISEKRNVSGTLITKYKIPFISHILFKISARLRRSKFFGDKSKGTLIRKIYFKIVRQNYKVISDKNKDAPSIPPLQDSTRKILYEFYKEDIKNLENLLRRDLSHWK
ncbi:MAG: sulfotransferase [Candidatus Heimdallarchaeota archaeon]